MSFFWFLIVKVTLCQVFFVCSFAIFCISVLNSSHRRYGLVSIRVVSRWLSLSSFSWMISPHWATFSIRALSCRDWSGHVQRPFPMSGASLVANLTDTSQWSVGIAVGPAFHSKRVCACLLAEYILSSLECIQSFPRSALYVKIRSFG